VFFFEGLMICRGGVVVFFFFFCHTLFLRSHRELVSSKGNKVAMMALLVSEGWVTFSRRSVV
jgi:hypothetical protein